MIIANIGNEIDPIYHWPAPEGNLELSISNLGAGTEFELNQGHWVMGALTLATITINDAPGLGMGTTPARLPFGNWWYVYVPVGRKLYAVMKSLVTTTSGFANKIDGVWPVPK